MQWQYCQMTVLRVRSLFVSLHSLTACSEGGSLNVHLPVDQNALLQEWDATTFGRMIRLSGPGLKATFGK